MRKVWRLIGIVVLVAFINACSDDEPSSSITAENLEVTIDENPSNGQVLGTVNATTTEGALMFDFTSQTPPDAMSIDSSTGEVTVADSALFNFELNSILTGKVSVSNGSESTVVDVIVTLNNVDESDLFNIWDGPSVSFTKDDGTDPTQEDNQDRITDNVWITRGVNGGQIYNAKTESTANKDNSPDGTLWAIGTFAEIEGLEFKPFREAVTQPKDVVGQDLVVYLVEDDAYISMNFSAWSQGDSNQGGFAYTRSSDPN